MSSQQRQTALPLEVPITEEDLRQAHEQCRLSHSFEDAMKNRALAIGIRNKARCLVMRRLARQPGR